MSATQASLFDVQPLIAVEYEAHLTLSERAGLWIEANDTFMQAFVRIAQEAQARGMQRLSAKFLVELMRWEWRGRTQGDGDYKINNSFTSFIAREAVRRCPSLDGLFEFREVR